MANFNKVLLMGNLTRDPEVRYTPKGTALANLGLAVNRVWSNEAGEKKEEVTFVDVEVWGRQAETSGNTCQGPPVFYRRPVEIGPVGRQGSGQKRSKLKVVCEEFSIYRRAPRRRGIQAISRRRRQPHRASSARPAGHRRRNLRKKTRRRRRRR